jgi:prolyl oligopeptidase
VDALIHHHQTGLIIPETENVLPSTGGGFILPLYERCRFGVKQYDYSGKMLREIQLPG